MARFPGTLKMGSNIEPRMDGPLDSRDVVELKADLTEAGSFPYSYIGMTVFVVEELKKYVLIGDDPTQIANWKIEESSSGGGDATLDTGLEAKVAVGGIPVGKTYAAGEDVEDILRDLLDPLAYPTLTGPSVSLAIVGPTVFEKGATPSVALRATPNRGKINPAYGTSGNRAGAVTEYQLVVDGTDDDTSTTGEWTKTITEGASYAAKATFAAGEQPKDSHGSDYDVAYTGGTISSPSISAQFVYCVWSNVADITQLAKETPKAPSTKEFTFVFPPQTVANPEKFSIPAAWSVKSVEVLNDLSGKYEDCSNEFAVTDATRQDAAGNDVAYKDYTDRRGYNADVRTIKLTIN